MLIGTYFTKKRLEKGLSLGDVAVQIGPDFQERLLWDFEAGDDTDIDGFSLQEFTRYCEILNISPAVYADIPISNMQDLALSDLIRTRREEMKLSMTALAEYIGYDVSVIHALEQGQRNVIVVLDVLKQIAVVLGLPFRALLEKL